MKSIFTRCAARVLPLCICIAAPACTADVHDNTLNVENPKVTIDTDVDVDDVKAGQSIAVSLHADDVYLIAPQETPPAEHADDSYHFQVYLDDTDSSPILVTIQLQVSVTIPANTPKGDHKLICRLHHHDGTPTESVSELDFKVTASTSVTVSADGGTQASTDAGE